jgi:hypothetical protein
MKSRASYPLQLIVKNFLTDTPISVYGVEKQIVLEM